MCDTWETVWSIEDDVRIQPENDSLGEKLFWHEHCVIVRKRELWVGGSHDSYGKVQPRECKGLSYLQTTPYIYCENCRVRYRHFASSLLPIIISSATSTHVASADCHRRDE